jgi:DNA invertase Pin-like site-specific DNA recombinase
MEKLTILYCRVSTSTQQKGLESQELALKTYCELHKIQDYMILKDEAISGGKLSRPSLNELLGLVKEGRVAKVIIYSFSRLARSTKFLLDTLDLFQEHGTELVSISEQLDTSSSTGRAIFTILGAISTLEKDLARERVLIGLENCKAKNIQLGRPITRNSELIQALRAKGYTYKEIGRLVGCSSSTAYREINCSKKNKK